MDTDRLIAQQIEYYRARAAGYRKEWDASEHPEFAKRWAREGEALRRLIDELAPRGHVLELAIGPGSWTADLLKTADRVTGIDGSEEMIRQASADLPADRIEFIVCDMFSWEPPRQYDDVFFGFWISHVPYERWDAFWALVARCLKPGGRAIFVDNAHPDHSEANGPGDWPQVTGNRPTPYTADQIQERTLPDDARLWQVVKRFWRPPELVKDLGRLGWNATVGETEFAFMCGWAEPRSPTG